MIKEEVIQLHCWKMWFTIKEQKILGTSNNEEDDDNRNNPFRFFCRENWTLCRIFTVDKSWIKNNALDQV